MEIIVENMISRSWPLSKAKGFRVRCGQRKGSTVGSLLQSCDGRVELVRVARYARDRRARTAAAVALACRLT